MLSAGLISRERVSQPLGRPRDSWSIAPDALQVFERRVGGRLFERGRFGVRPTELGRTVYPAAKRVLEALDSLAQLIELSRLRGAWICG